MKGNRLAANRRRAVGVALAFSVLVPSLTAAAPRFATCSADSASFGDAGIHWTTDRGRYAVGESARVTIEVDPTLGGTSIHLVAARDVDLGEAETTWEIDLPIESAKATVEVPLDVARTHLVAAVVVGKDGEVLRGGGIELVVDGGLEGMPEELGSYEVIDLDVEALRGRLDSAVANGETIELGLGSRTFALAVEDNSEALGEIDPDQLGNPGLYRGEIAGAPGSIVVLSIVEGGFHGLLDPSGPDEELDALVVVEPTSVHDPSRPPSEHVVYLARDVLVTGEEGDGPLEPEEEGLNLAPRVGDAFLGQFRLLVNLHFDTGATSRTTRRIATHVAAASRMLNRRISMNVRPQGALAPLDTDAFPNPDPSNPTSPFLQALRAALPGTGGDEVVDLLFTDNPANIGYSNRLGEAFRGQGAWAGDASAYAWVRNRGSDYRILLTLMHEIGHLLGVSDTGTGHSSQVLRSRCRKRIFGFCVKRHYVYSVMRATIDPSRVSAEFRSADRSTLGNVLTGTPGHFR